MKVIFLDYDGVLNDAQNLKNEVLEEHVQILKRIMEATGALVVVISNHKNEFLGTCPVSYKESICYLGYDFYLEQMGISIYDYTPCIESENILMKRELEINTYLHLHPEITNFVIIEDDYVIPSLIDHQVLIENCCGITEEHVKPSIDILNGKLGFYPPNHNREETLLKRLNRLLPDFHLEEMPFETEETCNLLLKIQRDRKDFK